MAKKRKTQYKLKLKRAGDPSLVPMGNNKLGARAIFREKTKYRDRAYPPLGAQPIDTFSSYNYLYGRIDDKFNAIYPAEENLKQLPVPDKEKSTMFAMNFVADAFSDLQEYFKKAARMGRIEQEETAYPTVEATLALSSEDSVHRTYGTYIQELYTVFVGEFMDSSLEQQILNFDDFIKIFLAYVTKVCYRGPFTRVAFCTSKYMNPRASGLVVELFEGKHDDDYAKYTGFLRDNNFSFFKRACERHGFMVDKNAPWRIFADIDSPYMREKMEDYGMMDREMLFPTYYIRAIDYEMDNLKTRLFQIYSLYVQQYPEMTILRPKSDALMKAGNKFGGQKTKITYKSRQQMTWDEFGERYGDEYWLRLLIYIRAVETNKPFTQREFEHSCRLACEYLNYVGRARAIEYVAKAYRHTDGELAENNLNKNLTGEEGCDILRTSIKLEFYRPSFYFRK